MVSHHKKTWFISIIFFFYSHTCALYDAGGTAKAPPGTLTTKLPNCTNTHAHTRLKNEKKKIIHLTTLYILSIYLIYCFFFFIFRRPPDLALLRFTPATLLGSLAPFQPPLHREQPRVARLNTQRQHDLPRRRTRVVCATKSTLAPPSVSWTTQTPPFYFILFFLIFYFDIFLSNIFFCYFYTMVRTKGWR